LKLRRLAEPNRGSNLRQQSNLYSNPTTTRTRKKQSASSGQAQAATTGVLRHQTSVPFEGFGSVSLPHQSLNQSTENIDTNTSSMF
jgi:hypothetical protein